MNTPKIYAIGEYGMEDRTFEVFPRYAHLRLIARDAFVWSIVIFAVCFASLAIQNAQPIYAVAAH